MDALTNSLQSIDPDVRRAALHATLTRIVKPQGLTEAELCRLRSAFALARIDPNPIVAAEARSTSPEDQPEAILAIAQTELRVLDVLHAESRATAVDRFDLLVRHLTTVDRLSCLPMAPRRVLCEWLEAVDEATLWRHLVERPSIAQAVVDLGFRRQTLDSLKDIGHLRRLASRRYSLWVQRLSDDLDLREDTDVVLDKVVRLVYGMERVPPSITSFVVQVERRFPTEFASAADRKSTTVTRLLKLSRDC